MLVTLGSRKTNLPDFFVIGVPKSATTSLFASLSNMKFFFPTKVKEPHYFVYKDLGKSFFVDRNGKPVRTTFNSFITDIDNYSQLYAGAKSHQLCGDFSTHYLRYAGLFSKNIKAVYQENYLKLKIIIILRDPIERAFSHYSMKRRGGNESLRFSEAINPETIGKRLSQGYLPTYDYIRFSRYHDDIQTIRNEFPQVLVVDFPKIISNPEESIQDILKFLNVESESSADLPKLNVSGIPKDNIFAKTIFNLLYRRSLLKDVLPSQLKRRIRVRLRLLFGDKIMKKEIISPDELEYANTLLRDEYKNFSRFRQG